MLTKQEVEHIAKLSRIELNDSELEAMRKDLSSIIGYVEKLKEVDIEGIEPATHSIDLKSVFRKDKKNEINLELSQSLIDLAPDKEKRHIKSKPVF